MMILPILAMILSAPSWGASSPLVGHALRLAPGDDIKLKLEEYVRERKVEAAAILSVAGSVTEAKVRLANQKDGKVFRGHFEVVSLGGTLSTTGGSHLHVSLSDPEGKTIGGHLLEGSRVYTTLEVVLGELKELRFIRETDPKTTFRELKVERR